MTRFKDTYIHWLLYYGYQYLCELGLPAPMNVPTELIVELRELAGARHASLQDHIPTMYTQFDPAKPRVYLSQPMTDVPRGDRAAWLDCVGRDNMLVIDPYDNRDQFPTLEGENGQAVAYKGRLLVLLDLLVVASSHAVLVDCTKASAGVAIELAVARIAGLPVMHVRHPNTARRLSIFYTAMFTHELDLMTTSGTKDAVQRYTTEWVREFGRRHT